MDLETIVFEDSDSDSLRLPSVNLAELLHSKELAEIYKEQLFKYISLDEPKLPDKLINYLSFVDITYFDWAHSDKPVSISFTPRLKTGTEEPRLPSYVLLLKDMLLTHKATIGGHPVFRNGLPLFRQRKGNTEGRLVLPETRLDLDKCGYPLKAGHCYTTMVSDL